MDNVNFTSLAPEEAAVVFRDRLLASHWPDNVRIAALTGAPPDVDLTPYGCSLRADGAVLGEWSAPDRHFDCTAFQFDTRGRIRPEVAGLLEMPPGEDDHGGWQRAFWLYWPHALLEGRTPADAFGHEPRRVIQVAKCHFDAHPNAGW